MKLKIKNNEVRDENGIIVAILTNASNEDVERTIELGSEVIPVVEEFVDGANNNKFKPKKAFDQFERLIEKHEI